MGALVQRYGSIENLKLLVEHYEADLRTSYGLKFDAQQI